MRIAESELILNPDGSIYHLQLRPGDIAETIITVGDQDRVDQISRHFDTIDLKVQHREFKTHTGTLNGKRLSVISTGIGPDNIDIVCNELDALVNVDFTTRLPKKNLTSLNIIRVGTSGSLQSDIPVDTFILSDIGVGFDNLLYYYGHLEEVQLSNFSAAFMAHTHWNLKNAIPYAVAADEELKQLFLSEFFIPGMTATQVGFYGPQGRVLRLGLKDPSLNDKLTTFEYGGLRITNMEMETAAIYGMARLMNHKALSLNAILANRSNGTFSTDPYKTIEKLIVHTLAILTT
jgi:uridine phosphorylase